MEFRRLGDGDYDIMAVFIAKYGFEALDMQYSFEVHGLKNNKQQKRSGDFYGFFDDANHLTGAFVFTNKRLMSGYFIDKEILKRVDFLKAIKHYSPLFVIGTQSCVDPIFNLLHRSLKQFTYDLCAFMMFPEEATVNSGDIQLIHAKDYDFKKAIEFLIEAEVAFGRNPKIINNLKQEIWEEAKASELYFLLHEDRIVAQGAIELETSQYCQVGGLYTAKIHRRRGYGEALMKAMVQIVKQKGKTPVLYVSKKNHTAVHLYEKMGFEVARACLSIHTEL
jgi:GNAT superfamily N-acetyltransferase